MRGVERPIDQYRVLAILIKGNMSRKHYPRPVILSRAQMSPHTSIGPTVPMQLSLIKKMKIGWITIVSGVSEPEYSILSAENPSGVSVCLIKTLESLPEGVMPVIIGDFLDNMIPLMDQSLFYKCYSDLASAARIFS